MVWFKVDDSFYDHPKVFDAPDSAVALWIRAGAWSARNLTNGFVPTTLPARLCDDPDTAVKELVRRGLWARASGGYQFHDWTDYQPSKDATAELREKRREAGRKGGLAKAAKQNAGKPLASARGVTASKTASNAVLLDENSDLKADWVPDEDPHPDELHTAHHQPERSNTPSNVLANAKPVGKQNPAPTRPVPISGHSRGVTNGEWAHEPPAQCSKHLDDPNRPPCGGCADARKRRDAWERDRLRAAAEKRQADARQRAEANRAAIDACQHCDDQGYRGGYFCRHDGDAIRRARQGSRAARATIPTPRLAELERPGAALAALDEVLAELSTTTEDTPA